MAERRISIQGLWSSRAAFILAATGAAIGLGNVWKFPYMAGANGGSAFVLIYLACVLCIGLPVMMAEVMLGRRGRRNPVSTMRLLSEEETGRRWWQLVGWGGMVTGLLILSYYSVIAGWAIAYAWRAASGMFRNMNDVAVARTFGMFLAAPGRLIVWHSVFILMTTIVVARGVRHGLERMVRYIMPALLIVLLILVGYALQTGAFMKGFHFMFDPDPGKIKAGTVLTAMGHAFFTLSLGMGAIMAYGSYLPEKASIMGTSLTVVIADTVVALLAGLAIFPVVFAYGLNPGEGPGLVFETLPLAFGHMAGGSFFGVLFFVLLVLAAWTSSISLLEPWVAWLVEVRGMRRGVAAALIGISAWLLGFLTIFSFNEWRDIRPFGRNLFQNIDFLASNILLPLGGLMIAIFAGWIMSKGSTCDEIDCGPGERYRVWRFLIRFVAPAGILLVFLRAVHVIGS